MLKDLYYTVIFANLLILAGYGIYIKRNLPKTFFRKQKKKRRIVDENIIYDETLLSIEKMLNAHNKGIKFEFIII